MYDTLKSLNICGICGSSPKVVMMLCPLSLPTTKAYMEFIGREKARAYLQCIYCKVKQWIQRELSQTIKLRCACVWNIWWIYMVANPKSTLLLKNLSLFWNMEIILQENRGYLIHLFFSGGHLSTHCFRYLRHLSIFLFFSLSFSPYFLWITFA